MLFFASDHIAGAHGAAIVTTADAGADATFGCIREAVMILRKMEVRRRILRMIAGAETQIFIDAVWIDDFAGIHFPVGIPNRFELAKRFDNFGAVHAREKLASRLP